MNESVIRDLRLLESVLGSSITNTILKTKSMGGAGEYKTVNVRKRRVSVVAIVYAFVMILLCTFLNMYLLAIPSVRTTFFGILWDMNYRKDYLHEGLTPEIIGRILSNRVLAFPLMIPIKEILPPAMNFDAELYNILNGGGKGLKALAVFKDGLVIALLAFLTYAYSTVDNSALIAVLAFGIPMLLFIGMPIAYAGDEDRFKLGDFFFAIVALALFAITYVFQHG